MEWKGVTRTEFRQDRVTFHLCNAWIVSFYLLPLASQNTTIKTKPPTVMLWRQVLPNAVSGPEDGQSSKIGPPYPVDILLTTMSIVDWHALRVEGTGDCSDWIVRLKDWDGGRS